MAQRLPVCQSVNVFMCEREHSHVCTLVSVHEHMLVCLGDFSPLTKSTEGFSSDAAPAAEGFLRAHTLQKKMCSICSFSLQELGFASQLRENLSVKMSPLMRRQLLIARVLYNSPNVFDCCVDREMNGERSNKSSGAQFGKRGREEEKWANDKGMQICSNYA